MGDLVVVRFGYWDWCVSVIIMCIWMVGVRGCFVVRWWRLGLCLVMLVIVVMLKVFCCICIGVFMVVWEFMICCCCCGCGLYWIDLVVD